MFPSSQRLNFPISNMVTQTNLRQWLSLAKFILLNPTLLVSILPSPSLDLCLLAAQSWFTLLRRFEMRYQVGKCAVSEGADCESDVWRIATAVDPKTFTAWSVLFLLLLFFSGGFTGKMCLSFILLLDPTNNCNHSTNLDGSRFPNSTHSIFSSS